MPTAQRLSIPSLYRLARWSHLSGPLILTLVHLLVIAAVASFAWRVGSPPLSDVGWRAYVVAAVFSATAVLATLRGAPDEERRLLPEATVLLPVMTSVVLYCAIGGDYAPWDAHDSDIVGVEYSVVAAAFVAASLLAGSWRLLSMALTSQPALYFAVLPGSLVYGWRYGLPELLGPRPECQFVQSPAET